MGYYNKYFYQIKSPILKKIRKLISNLLLTKCNRVLFLGNEELNYFKKIFNKHNNKASFFRFRIDDKFWSLKGKEKKFNDPYILFIGNDSMRDYKMLINIANELPNIKFKIVSNTFKNSFNNRNKNINTGNKKKN